MIFKDFSELTKMHKIFLEGLGYMGAENVSTELSNMFFSLMDISPTQVAVNHAPVAGKLADMLNENAEMFQIRFSEDMKGSLLFSFPYPTIEKIVSAYFPDTSIQSKDDMNEMIESVVRETVNIAAASYANRLAFVSGLKVDISVPIPVEIPSKEVNEICSACNGTVCCLENSLQFPETHHLFDLIFYPEISTIASFIEKMGT